MSVLSFREGRAGDLRATFDLGEAALDVSRIERGLLPADHRRPDADLDARWDRERALLEFIVAQADGAFVICEEDDQLVGYTRVARFGEMDELTELWVAPSHSGLGVGRAMLDRCWPDSPTPELGLTMPDHRPGADQDHKRTHVLIQGPTGQSPRRRCRSCICSDAFVPTPRNNGLIGSTQVSAGGDNAGMEA